MMITFYVTKKSSQMEAEHVLDKCKYNPVNALLSSRAATHLGILGAGFSSIQGGVIIAILES